MEAAPPPGQPQVSASRHYAPTRVPRIVLCGSSAPPLVFVAQPEMGQAKGARARHRLPGMRCRQA
eukprot:1140908-Pelagomonas_calceolata.AAC.3